MALQDMGLQAPIGLHHVLNWRDWEPPIVAMSSQIRTPLFCFAICSKREPRTCPASEHTARSLAAMFHTTSSTEGHRIIGDRCSPVDSA